VQKLIEHADFKTEYMKIFVRMIKGDDDTKELKVLNPTPEQ